MRPTPLLAILASVALFVSGGATAPFAGAHVHADYPLSNPLALSRPRPATKLRAFGREVIAAVA